MPQMVIRLQQLLESLSSEKPNAICHPLSRPWVASDILQHAAAARQHLFRLLAAITTAGGVRGMLFPNRPVHAAVR